MARGIQRRASAVNNLPSGGINVVRDALLFRGGARSSALVRAPINITSPNFKRKAVASGNVRGAIGIIWVDWGNLGSSALHAIAFRAKTGAIVISNVRHDYQLAECATFAFAKTSVGVHDAGALRSGSIGSERALTSAVFPLSVACGLAGHRICLDSRNGNSEDQWLLVLAP